VVETSSFSTAAVELYISQSSLSKQILGLEKELGFPLFDRSKRKIALKPAGESFLHHALRINQVYQTMLDETKQYKATPSLSIVVIPVIAQYGITTYIAQFKNTYPNIHLILEEREATAILPALTSHQFDLAFLRDNYHDPDLSTVLEVAPDKLLVVLSSKHRFAARKSLALVELSDENFIMFDKGTVVHELVVDACRNAGFEPRISYSSLRVESVLGMVASNSGIALMMEKVFTYHQPSDVIAIPLDETIESHIVLATLKNKPISKVGRCFINFMKESLGIN